MNIVYLPLVLILAASARLDAQPAGFSPTTSANLAQELLQQNAASDSGEDSSPATVRSEWQAGILPQLNRPNEIPLGRGTADGIFIELFKTDNPLQLINPAAPERYGSATDNTVQDITSRKTSGLKILEFRF